RAAFFKVTNRAAPNERLGNLVHLDSALYPRMYTFFFQSILQSQCIYHRGQHAHKIARGAIDFEALLARAAKNVSAANHDGRFHAQGVHVLYLPRDSLNGFAVNPEALRALE